MMGNLVSDVSLPVTKTTGGFIVLPVSHPLVKRRNQTTPEMKKIGQSACDQCSYCTEFCPRYLLGYQIEPHKVMRSLGFAGERDDFWGTYAMNCCECNLCSLFACPEDLDPKQACVRSKTNIKLKRLEYTPPDEAIRAHPMQSHRKVSISRLTRKLGLVPYDVHADYIDDKPKPSRVIIPLSQHIGNAAEPVVKAGDTVSVGQLIGDIPANVLGAPVHASINGRVTEVSSHIIIQAE
jgi:Na+-translocating ferredoxin:NAD+ oxidoreductase RnfC subunit